MRDFRQLLSIRVRVQIDIAQRVEIFDLAQVQFLGERTAPCKA
jgi:hypothetical protein